MVDPLIQSDSLEESQQVFSGQAEYKITIFNYKNEPFEVNQSVALIETASNHGLGIGDNVTIDINPDDATKTKIYYIRDQLNYVIY